ncbi:5'-nucleotidase [Oerskovia gallyi]|uniref:5'-nucleotidase n=1 Tax=Oerskovia gallyi TaxID=2762226 RepID=A0ABR8UWS3_9CELL|nr:5'-nucleotidase [Oerskovia gallyi]MBD7996997.1 5'-nucleotidase [Oerskovia gallyi]
MPPYDLDHRLVVGVSSSALFDLSDSQRVFDEQGIDAYRGYQDEHLDRTLRPGVAFEFVQRLLSLNDLSPSAQDPLVEVFVLSKNDPTTGLRVMSSVAAHGLPISRSIFTQGLAPYAYIPALNISLFLSGDARDVRTATLLGHPAGQVLGSAAVGHVAAAGPTAERTSGVPVASGESPGEDSDGAADDGALRVAFDFDGVLADDSAERIFQSDGLEQFHRYESARKVTEHHAGPILPFLRALSTIQRREEERVVEDPTYRPRVRVSIVTARSAPSHERAVNTLRSWGVTVNDAFFMGGADKGRVLRVLRPHIFFDDQRGHLDPVAREVASVLVPYGVTNEEVPVAAVPVERGPDGGAPAPAPAPVPAPAG